MVNKIHLATFDKEIHKKLKFYKKFKLHLLKNVTELNKLRQVKFIVHNRKNTKINEQRKYAKKFKIKLISYKEILERTYFFINDTEHSKNWIINKNIYIKYIKYLFEIFILIIISPLLIITAVITSILIKISIGSPLIFRQKRMGKNNEEFTMYKFRTMIKNKNIDGETKRINDPRINKICLLIRKLKLDEIPQIINIIQGKMSLIGPRPETIPLSKKYSKYIPNYSCRTVLNPGITGWAQVNQRYAVGIQDSNKKLKYDLYYIKNCTFRLDLIIIWKTIIKILN